jgi:hypothetical protein
MNSLFLVALAILGFRREQKKIRGLRKGGGDQVNKLAPISLGPVLTKLGVGGGGSASYTI